MVKTGLNPKEIDKKIDEICRGYVIKWLSKDNRIIKTNNFSGIHIEGNYSPLEEFSLMNQLASLSKENKEFPSRMHEMQLENLRRLPIHLTRTVSVSVNNDHELFWAWTAQFRDCFNAPSSVMKDNDIKIAMTLLFHVVLAKLIDSSKPFDEWDDSRKKSQLVDSNITETINGKPIIASPLSLLIFEAIIRDLCSDYVNKDGITKLEVNLPGSNKPLAKKTHVELRIILRIFEDLVLQKMPSEFQSDFFEMNQVIEEIWGLKPDGTRNNWKKIICDWRNSLLHGNKTWMPKVYGTMVNFICLILWHEVSNEEYMVNKKLVLQLSAQKYLFLPPSLWPFYRPILLPTGGKR